jgi:hypothetical protein
MGAGGAGAALAGIEGLADLWREATGRVRRGADPCRWMADRILLDALGLGLEQVRTWLGSARPDFDAFCDWIAATAGLPSPERIERYRDWRAGRAPSVALRRALDAIDAAPPVLDADALAHWRAQGYVVLRGAIGADEAAAAADLLWTALGASPDDPDSWYGGGRQGIMVQLFQHPAMEAARRSPRIHKAFAQLLGGADLWATVDRMSFNPPQRPGHPFQGPHLHWDASLAPPIPLATQGILYLTDTAADQGPLVLVPGFHRRHEAWLAGLPRGADPRRCDLSGEAVPVAAGAGDLIIWHQALPHGASPNCAARPRLAQYVNMYSPAQARAREWL